MITTELFSAEKHYEKIAGWFAKRNFPAPNPRYLPQIGAVAYCGDRAIGCGFLFRTDAGYAVIGHLGTDPDASGKERNAALDAIMHMLTGIAIGQGFELVSCSTSIPKLMERFERLGFEKTDTEVSIFRRIVCR